MVLVHPQAAAAMAVHVLAQLFDQHMQLLLARRLTFLYWEKAVLAMVHPHCQWLMIRLQLLFAHSLMLLQRDVAGPSSARVAGPAVRHWPSNPRSAGQRWSTDRAQLAVAGVAARRRSLEPGQWVEPLPLHSGLVA